LQSEQFRESKTKEKSMAGDTAPQRARTLWIVQGLLALIFLGTGGAKLVLPMAPMPGPIPLSPLFLKFIGACEVLGAIGLILPGLVGIRPGLTPLAAAGLVVIMIGATVVTLALGMIALALIPFVVGLLAAYVAYARSPYSRSPHSRL
jgi:hypothetical protein